VEKAESSNNNAVDKTLGLCCKSYKSA